MPFRPIDARQVQGFVLWFKFSDGVEGEIDLRDELDGPIFEPLKKGQRVQAVPHRSRSPYSGVAQRSRFCAGVSACQRPGHRLTSATTRGSKSTYHN